MLREKLGRLLEKLGSTEVQARMRAAQAMWKGGKGEARRDSKTAFRWLTQLGWETETDEQRSTGTRASY